MRYSFVAAAGAVLILACDASSPLAPVGSILEARSANAAGSVPTISVMTRNVYPGTDLDAVIAALANGDPSDDIPALVLAYQVLRHTDWPTRAGAIADEIARAGPMVVGLQEVSEFDLDFSALYPDFVPVLIDYQVDFLPILMEELADRGLAYSPISITNIDVDVAPAPIVTARFVDHDVLLIRDDLAPTAVGGANFTACLGPAPCLGGVPFTLKRGFVYASISVLGEDVMFVSAHPESGRSVDVASVRALQVAELLGWIGAYATGPVILMGDLNEAPDVDLVPGVPGVYEMLMAAGFTDVWASLRPGASGYTCCHDADLSDIVPSGFDERIDYLLTRGLGRSGPGLQGQIGIVGLRPSARVMGPEGLIWPSDHAGVVGQLRFPRFDD